MDEYEAVVRMDKELAEHVLVLLMTEKEASEGTRQLYNALHPELKGWVSGELPGEVPFFGGEIPPASRWEARIRAIAEECIAERAQKEQAAD